MSLLNYLTDTQRRDGIFKFLEEQYCKNYDRCNSNCCLHFSSISTFIWQFLDLENIVGAQFTGDLLVELD